MICLSGAFLGGFLDTFQVGMVGYRCIAFGGQEEVVCVVVFASWSVDIG